MSALRQLTESMRPPRIWDAARLPISTGAWILTIEEGLDYISKTAWFVMGLVNQKHGLRIYANAFVMCLCPL
jgi:hypothetical protein